MQIPQDFGHTGILFGSLIGKFGPQSLYFQELNLAETAVNRLQTVGLRFCGVADQALPRLRGALPPGILSFIAMFTASISCITTLKFLLPNVDKTTHKALEDLSQLFNYLRVWRLDQRVYVDALMPPTESYHRNLFFQVSVPSFFFLGNFLLPSHL